MDLLRMCNMTVLRENPDASCVMMNAKFREEAWTKIQPVPSLVVDMPPGPEHVHGSSVTIRCKRKCEAEGDLVVPFPEKSVDIVVDEAEKWNCRVKGVHSHVGRHVHIRCKDMEQRHVRKLLNFIKFM